MKRDEPFLRRMVRALVSAFRAILNEDAPRDAAAISYFSLSALFPAILLLIALADASLGWFSLYRADIVQRIISLFPGSRRFLQENVDELTAPSPAVTISCIIIVVWCSSWICAFIENALSRAWGVVRRRPFWESRVRGIALMALGGMCLLTSAAFSAVVSAAQAQSMVRTPAFADDPIIHRLWSLVFLAAGSLIAVIVFALIYKLMPDCQISWFEALSGSIAATFIWEVGSYLFVRIVPYFDYQRVYGKAGAIIALLVWVYTSNLIMLYGANFAAQFHRPESGNPSRKTHSNSSADSDCCPDIIRPFPHSR
jgi:membrane protein